MNTDLINPLELPSVPYSLRRDLPESSGLYFCIRKAAVLYIGMSGNLKSRWTETSHHVSGNIERLDHVRIAYLEVDASATFLKELEAGLIEKYSPRFNKAGNPIKNQLEAESRISSEDKIFRLEQEAKSQQQAAGAKAAKYFYRMAEDMRSLAAAAEHLLSIAQSLEDRSRRSGEAILEVLGTGGVPTEEMKTFAVSAYEYEIMMKECRKVVNGLTNISVLKQQDSFGRWAIAIEGMVEDAIKECVNALNSSVHVELSNEEKADWMIFFGDCIKDMLPHP